MGITLGGRLRGMGKLPAGVSVLALGAGLLAGPAMAQQVVVGSPQCGIVDGVANCSGDLSDGVVSDQSLGDAPVRTINVGNAAGPIAPAGWYGVGVSRDDGDVTLNLADGVQIDVYDDLAEPGFAQGVAVLLRNGHAVTIDSGATITSNANGTGAGGPGAGIEGTSSGAGGSVSITNRGAITVDSTLDRSIAIAGGVYGGADGDIRITNSGTLIARSSATGERENAVAGILARDNTQAPSGGQIVINNSGTIRVETNPASVDTDFDGIAGGIVTNALTTNSNTAITNTGAISGTGSAVAGIVSFARGTDAAGDTDIDIDNGGALSVDGTGYGIMAQSAGEQVDIDIRNVASGTISMVNVPSLSSGTTGIYVLHQARSGEVAVNNAAAISTAGVGFTRGIGISTGGALANGDYTLSIENSGDLTIGTASGQGILINATLDDNAVATLTNSGDIDLTASTSTSSNAISVNLGGTSNGDRDGTTSATIVNRGAISVRAGGGIYASADSVSIDNSGTITTAGQYSDGVTIGGTGDGEIYFRTRADMSVAGADSSVISLFGTADKANIAIVGATLRAPQGSHVIDVDGTIRISMFANDEARLLGDMRLGSGNDFMSLYEGSAIVGDVSTGAGNDSIFLADGAFIDGVIDLGAGDDLLSLDSPTAEMVLAIDQLDGGEGTDRVELRLAEGTEFIIPGRVLNITNVEQVAQRGNATVTLTGAIPEYEFDYLLEEGTLNHHALLYNSSFITSANTMMTVSGTMNNLVVGGAISPSAAPPPQQSSARALAVSVVGDGIGTVNALGDVTFLDGSTYLVDILADGSSDLIASSSTASLQGGTVVISSISPEEDFDGSTTYTILSASGGVTGTFAGLDGETLPFLALELVYDPQTVQLAATRAMEPGPGPGPDPDPQPVPFASIARTYNQTQIAQAFDTAEADATGDMDTVIDALIFSTEERALTAFNTSSGEIHAAVLAVGMRQARYLPDAMQQRIQAVRGSGAAAGLWASGGLAGGSLDSDGNAEEIQADSYSFALGADYVDAAGRFLIGVAGGYQATDIDLHGRSSSAELESWQLGAYARIGTGRRGFTAGAAAAYSTGDAEIRRSVAINTMVRTAGAEYDLESISLDGQLRYGFGAEGSSLAIGPVATIEYVDIDRGAFIERGADALNLIGGDDGDSLTSWGAGGFINWTADGTSLDLAVIYQNGEGDFTDTWLALAGAPSASFLVRSPQVGDDALGLRFAGEMPLSGNWSVGAGYRGQVFGGGMDSHSGMLTLSSRW